MGTLTVDGEAHQVVLQDLPTVVESYKTLDDTNLVKVADIGLVRSALLAGLTPAVPALDTLAYAPPEQITNPKAADPRSDIYSLGATCYHLLTGELAFRAGSLADLLRAIAATRPRALRSYREDTPADLDAILARAMAPNPAARFPNADDFRSALKALRL